ncbi:MAG: cache domain-containing protein [Candidatus Sumerlaeota bacterium]
MQSPKFHLRLTGKFLLPIVFILLIGALVSIYASYQYTINGLRNLIRSNLEQQTLSVAHNIDNWLSKALSDLAFFSKNQVFADALQQEGYFGRSARASALREMGRMASEHSSVEQVYLVSIDKEFLITPSGASSGLSEIIEQSDFFRPCEKVATPCPIRCYHMENRHGPGFLRRLLFSLKTGKYWER